MHRPMWARLWGRRSDLRCCQVARLTLVRDDRLLAVAVVYYGAPLRRATPIVAVHGVDSPRGLGTPMAPRKQGDGHANPTKSLLQPKAEQGARANAQRAHRKPAGKHAAGARPDAKEQIWHGDDAITRRQISVTVDCEAVQISVVDSSPMELLYVTLGGFSASFTEGLNEEDSRRIEQRFQLDLKSIQVDNQRYRSSLPVTLARGR